MSDGESIGNGRCTKETDLALLVALDDADETWVPKSVVHDDSEVYEEGQYGDVVVKRWWAEKQGLI